MPDDCLQIGFLEYLRISGEIRSLRVEMDPSVTERRQLRLSGKKPVLCMCGLLSTIIRGREQEDPKSAFDGKIAQAITNR